MVYRRKGETMVECMSKKINYEYILIYFQDFATLGDVSSVSNKQINKLKENINSRWLKIWGENAYKKISLTLTLNK